MDRWITRFAIGAAALVVAACASTTIKDSWVDPSVRTVPFGKVLVVAVGDVVADTHDEDPAKRPARIARIEPRVPKRRRRARGEEHRREQQQRQ